MRFEWDNDKEQKNIRTHKLDFSFAEFVFDSPLAVIVYDRYESEEHRYHTFAWVGARLLLVVHTYPDPDDHEWIRVIGLREATAHERKRYEEGDSN